MTKDEILIKIEHIIATEQNMAKLYVQLYDLNFAYNRLLMIEGMRSNKITLTEEC